MNRPVLIHAALLGVALVAAYFVWTREPDTSEDQIPVVSIREGLDRVLYSTEDRKVEINKKKDEHGSYHWVKVETVTKKPVKKPKPPEPAVNKRVDGGPPVPTDAGVAKAATDATPRSDTGVPAKPEMKEVRKQQAFKGNEALDKLVKSLAELNAVRSLGMISGDKLKSFGLHESKKTLTLVTGSTPRTFIIGDNTYGNMDIYIQDKQDRRVYVINPRSVQDLKYAEFRLMERELHGFNNTEMDRVLFKTDKGQKTLVQKNRRTPATAFWADAEAPDKGKDFFKNWMSKLSRLRATEYAKQADKLEGLTEKLSAEYYLGGKKLGYLKLYQLGASVPAGAPKGKNGDDEYYAQTENTRAKVKLSRRLGEEVVKDLENLLKN